MSGKHMHRYVMDQMCSFVLGLEGKKLKCNDLVE